ncbi:outer membrane beta-barrel protein [Gemmatimonas sp.]|uniref:outer membrane beta-barrel protein n=1 Tax=Gemmatimonas sp. TaxID=1962908 RepID=UPI0037C17E97
MVALLSSLALSAGVAGAQLAPKQFSVTTRLGTLSPERAASMDAQALVGLDAEYNLSKYFGIGTAIDVSRGNTRREDFLTRLRFGQAAVAGGDSIYYQYVSQPVNLVNLGLMGTLRYPGKKITPFVTGGVGTYVMILDAQINGKETRTNDLSLTGGAGVSFKLSDRAGIQLDVRTVQLQGFSRDFLNPARGREVLTVPFPEDFPTPPAAKNTALNTMISLGFRYIPGGN